MAVIRIVTTKGEARCYDNNEGGSNKTLIDQVNRQRIL